uniref:ORF51f n=1 Tax=Pinus koraiensis TaxID=88728 RepID=A4QMD1_PINKO|nr:ORF51f [Pinus koraiensis]
MADRGNRQVLFKVFFEISSPNIISLDQEEDQRIIRYTKNIGSRKTTRSERE